MGRCPVLLRKWEIKKELRMKKLLVCMSVIFALSAGITALAADADYNNDSNSANLNAKGYKTVLIKKSDSDDIVYVDQDDNGLDSVAEFFLKEKPAEGSYVVMLGSDTDADVKELNLVIGPKAVPVTTSTTVLGKEYSSDKKTYSIGCIAEDVAPKGCKYVVVTATNTSNNTTGKMCIETGFQITGEGTVNVGIKITDIEAGYDVTVGLSDMEVQ